MGGGRNVLIPYVGIEYCSSVSEFPESYDEFASRMDASPFPRGDDCRPLYGLACRILKRVVDTITTVLKNGYSEELFQRDDTTFSASLGYEVQEYFLGAGRHPELPYLYIGANPLSEGLEITARILDFSKKKESVCFIRYIMKTVSNMVKSQYVDLEGNSSRVQRWDRPMGPWIVMDFKNGEHIKETAGYKLDGAGDDRTAYFFRRLMCPDGYPNELIDQSVKKSILSVHPNMDWTEYIRIYFCGMSPFSTTINTAMRYTKDSRDLKEFLSLPTLDYVTSYKIHQKGLNFSPISQDLIISVDSKTGDDREFVFFCSSKFETFGSCFNMKNIDSALKVYYEENARKPLIEQKNLCSKVGFTRENGTCSEFEVLRGIRSPNLHVWTWILSTIGIILICLIIAAKLYGFRKLKALITSRRAKKE